MILTMSSFYSEPGCKFCISHRVDNLIRDNLRLKIMEKYRLDTIDKDYFLDLSVTTNSKTTVVQVKGPDIDKKNKFYNCGLWLPYEAIAKADDQLPPYLKYLFDALAIFFGQQYDVKEEDIRNIQNEIEAEVIGNLEYEFNEDITEPLDISKLNLD